jgi:hypothetical protein
MTNIRIPPCYQEPLEKWLRGEYRDYFRKFHLRYSQKRMCAMFKMAHLHLMPVLTQTQIVFAVCTEEDDRMIRALKLERQPGLDAPFIIDLCAHCSK